MKHKMYANAKNTHNLHFLCVLCASAIKFYHFGVEFNVGADISRCYAVETSTKKSKEPNFQTYKPTSRHALARKGRRISMRPF